MGPQLYTIMFLYSLPIMQNVRIYENKSVKDRLKLVIISQRGEYAKKILREKNFYHNKTSEKVVKYWFMTSE